ncbi:MAG: glycosyltransferase [Myxococcales bacterium]|nr:glycosyltransferase [Myxococcales bacterium]MCB9736791.1 glycosyltransferase [Deltaproteobacteria bacterium]
MRIGIVGPADVGHGTARVVQDWAIVLAGAGHEVLVVDIAPAGAPPLDLGADVVRRLQPPSGRGGITGLVASARAAARVVAHEHRERAFDLVVTHLQLEAIAVRQAVPGVPILGTWHSPLVDESRLNDWVYGSARRRLTWPARRLAFEAIERAALRSVNAIHTLSRFTWQRLTDRYGGLERRTPWHLVPGTYDEQRFHPEGERRASRRALGLPEAGTLLVAVRRLVPRNGVERLIAAAAAARSAGLDARFAIAGGGWLREALEADIAARGLDGRVTLLGRVPDAELPLLYRAGDAALMPTRELECFGLPAIEALGSGTPCLATPCGGLKEVLEPFPAWVARENGDAAFTELVLAFLRGELPRDGEVAHASATTRFSRAAVGPAILKAVEAAARG